MIQLSPHGESYCRVCRFIQPVGANGRIEHHLRSSVGEDYGWQRKECRGSGRKRHTGRPPYFSRLNAFVCRRYGLCSKCGQREPLSRWSFGPAIVSRHRAADGLHCNGTNLPPAS